MFGVFRYISFLAIYYLILALIDLVGSVLEYRKTIIASDNPSGIKFKVDFNSDLAAVSFIYLVSYYSGVFDA